jgi:hypothetical protein
MSAQRGAGLITLAEACIYCALGQAPAGRRTQTLCMHVTRDVHLDLITNSLAISKLHVSRSLIILKNRDPPPPPILGRHTACKTDWKSLKPWLAKRRKSVKLTMGKV